MAFCCKPTTCNLRRRLATLHGIGCGFRAKVHGVPRPASPIAVLDIPHRTPQALRPAATHTHSRVISLKPDKRVVAVSMQIIVPQNLCTKIDPKKRWLGPRVSELRVQTYNRMLSPSFAREHSRAVVHRVTSAATHSRCDPAAHWSDSYAPPPTLRRATRPPLVTAKFAER